MTSTTEHRTVMELLPWYVNGTLPEAERRSVERHLRECLPCRAALKDERRLAAVLHGRASDNVSMERNFERLVDRIRTPQRPPRGARAFAGLRHGIPSSVIAATAVTLVAALIGTALWLGVRHDGTGYSTATSTVQDASQRIDIIFAAGVDERQIRELLASINGTIIGGPSDLGRYTVRLSEQLNDAELRALLARLNEDERVRFAGHSFIEVPKK